MLDRHRYITLVTSLPHLGKLFSQTENPLSEFRLKQRLAMLAPDHRDLLDRILAATTWAGVADCREDREVMAKGQALLVALGDYPTLQSLVVERLQTRTVISALRRRRDGDDSAGDIAAWGMGDWCQAISQNWTDPGFGLSHFQPWILKADACLRSGDHIAMERLVLTRIFDTLDRADAQHGFDFEAVAIYVLRWVIVERWSRYNAEAARDRLRGLVEDVLHARKDMNAASPGGPAPSPAATPQPSQEALP